MNSRNQVQTKTAVGHSTTWPRWLSILAILALVLGLQASGGSQGALAQPNLAPAEAAEVSPLAQVATTSTIALNVSSARTEPDAFDGGGVTAGDPVTAYQFMINVDNTGDPTQDMTSGNLNPPLGSPCNPFLDEAMTVRNPDYPELCDWPSLRTVPGWAPIYFQGDQSQLNGVTTLDLPPGKYLISVVADGYKIDGEHLTIPAEDPDGDGVALIEVGLQPYPLPSATMVIMVFEDNSMANGQFDAPVEHGLAGFRASINDIAGEVTTDMFGNPLNTEYDANGEPIPFTGGPSLSKCYVVSGGVDIGTISPIDADGRCPIDATGLTETLEGVPIPAGAVVEGKIIIKNIGPIRWDVLVFRPTGSDWVQTTTLEGSQGWDTWLQEGGTGLDNEFVVAGEPFPWTVFGYVKPNAAVLGGTGSISGQVWAAATYIPTVGGLPFQGTTFGGLLGTMEHRPIVQPWLALNDLQNGDTAVWVGQGAMDGTFEITNVPAGNYVLTYWDEKQHYILDLMQVTVFDGQVTDVAHRHLTGWFTEISGTVFNDLNENGLQDPGEPPIPNYLVVLKDRDNTEIDRMSIASLTNANGAYELEKGYPMGSWMILEAYSDLYYTTGISYQTLNMTTTKVITGGIVDIGLLPILGQPVRLDWGVKRYSYTETGGIAGTVFYDTVRAEDEGRYAGAEPWQPGIPGLTLNLYQAQMDMFGQPIKAADGSYAKGQLLAVTETETYARPKGCQALDVNGDPIDYAVLPLAADGHDCVEGPLMGTQIGDGQNNLDGNWGFGEGCFGPGGFDALTGTCADGNAPTPLPSGNYLVEVEIPSDVSGNSMFKVTSEEDLNIFDGDEFVPAVPPPACAGPLHIVDVANSGTDNYPGYTFDEGGVTISVPDSVPVANPGYADAGGSRYEGMTFPKCNVKHVYLSNSKAVAPIFTLFTDVPIPGKWKGYIIDNLNISTNPFELFYGEMAPVPNVPIGLYDFTGRLVETIHSDRNGVYETLLPSTLTNNAPSPSGTFANVYYLYGNDPGPIGFPNLDYNPQYRSIGTSFEIYPGNIMPSDLAPFQNGVSIWAPGSQVGALPRCDVEAATPQIYAVSRPYGSRLSTFTIDGLGFGDTRGTVLLENLQVAPGNILSWTDRQIRVRVPIFTPVGPRQLTVRSANGQTNVNGLTFHVIGGSYTPNIFEVGPGRAYDPLNYDGTSRGPIQHAIDDAWASGGNSLVVVYPGMPVPLVNPLGMYLENLVVYAPVKLQGVGPGGTYPDAAAIPGSLIDGRGVGGDAAYSEWWRGTLIPDIWNNRGGWDRGLMVDAETPQVYEGAVITVLGEAGEFGSGFPATIDGFIIEGGDQQGFPNNPAEVEGFVAPQNIVVQGGGIFVDGYAPYLRITNNIIRSNGGTYAGAVRLGTPNIAQPLTDNHNDNVKITYNRILANGGTNLAGAVGVFAGTDNYEIAYNDLCGNFSAEYGGGISHYGYSPNGSIHHNRIFFNRSYDEGGGIMIAGELPADPTLLSPGAGPVNIYNNMLQSNLANDDGGGLRFLMAGNFIYNVFNNLIVNNISTHEGGGISLNDAPSVRIAGNTIMNNITTATALTSNGLPAPAGLASSANSALLQATLPPGADVFSNPVVFNNIFWDNRAGFWNGDAVSGIGLLNDPNPINYWDLGVADGSGNIDPYYCLLQEPAGGSNNLVGQDPLVIEEYETSVAVLPWRGNQNVVGINLVALDLPVTLLGNYHLQPSSPAIDEGTYLLLVDGSLYLAPLTDYDNQFRLSGPDIGADEEGEVIAANSTTPMFEHHQTYLPVVGQK